MAGETRRFAMISWQHDRPPGVSLGANRSPEWEFLGIRVRVNLY